MKTVLQLTLTVDLAHVRECAEALAARLEPTPYQVLAALAAQIVADWETRSAGCRILVVPALEKGAEVEKALALRVPQGLA